MDNEILKINIIDETPVIEKCLVEWIKQTLDKNIPIDRTLLKQKKLTVKIFAMKTGTQNFSARNCWLNGFKTHDKNMTCLARNQPEKAVVKVFVISEENRTKGD